MDSQGFGVAIHAARQGDEPSRAIGAGERPGAPGRRQAASVGDDPDLEDLRRVGFLIVFAMDDTRAGAHYLDVPGLGASLVALVVAVADRALADIGNDFH